MAKRNNAAPTSRTLTREAAQVQDFANSNAPLETLTQQTSALLTTKDLVTNVRALTGEDQAKFVDKADQVCQVFRLFRNTRPIIPAKAYRPLSLQNVKYVNALGNVCGAILLLPTSAVLSTGLEKRGNIAVASGGFTDVWRGDLGDLRVAIKAFRIYPAQNLKEAKEVSIQPACKVC